MDTKRYVYWQDEERWLGYFEEYPDYWTEGHTMEELKENLRSLYADVSGGEIAGIRRVDELTIS